LLFIYQNLYLFDFEYYKCIYKLLFNLGKMVSDKYHAAIHREVEILEEKIIKCLIFR